MNAPDITPVATSLSDRTLGVVATIALQFSIGHTLGFGAWSLMNANIPAVAILSAGDVAGVCLAGWIAGRLIPSRKAMGIRQVTMAAIGGATGFSLLVLLGRSGYASALIPLAAAITGFHLAVRRATRTQGASAAG
jgi:hypothetical protein